MRRRSTSLVPAILWTAAAGVVFGMTAVAQNAPPPSDEHPALPPGPGRELMIRVCSPCHSPDVAAEQQLDQAGWKALVDQMASKGVDATDEELDAIIQYLAHAFPAN